MNVIGLRVRPGACHRCRFLADFVLKLLVDKVAPELLVLDCAAEAGTGPSRPIHDAPTPGPQRAGGGEAATPAAVHDARAVSWLPLP